MVNIILFGPPGAGKGTQAINIVEKFGLTHLSTGDIFRANMKNDTELGKLAKGYINKGELVPDDVTIKMLQSEVENSGSTKGFIFDGFPRTSDQAIALDAFLDSKNTSISALLSLEVEEAELMKRLLERGKTSGRADDIDVDIIKNRISQYNDKTAPVINHYDSQNKYHSVEGIGSVEDIFGRLSTIINKL